MGVFRLAAWGLVGAAALQLVMMVALCGGPANFWEVLQPSFLPAQPASALDVNLSGKNVLITGANRGYGYAATVHLAKAGASIIMACRSGIPEAGVSVARDAGVPQSRVTMEKVDLSKPESIAHLANRMNTAGVKIDFLVLNAVALGVEPRKIDGVNLMFWVNYLANVFLVRDLASNGVFRARDGNDMPRILYVTSGSIRKGSTASLGEDRDFDPLTAMKYYGHTKFLTQVFVDGLSRGKGPAGIDLANRVQVASHSPGPVYSGLGQEHVPALLWPFYSAMKESLFPSAADAAEPILSLCKSSVRDHKFLHIRIPSNASKLAKAAETHDWLVKETDALLARLSL